MTIGTPSSLGNDDRAALLIQAAYRRHAVRKDASRRATTNALETLEEHDEAKINARAQLMAKMDSRLKVGLKAKFARGMQRLKMATMFGKLKVSGEGDDAQTREDIPPLPSLTDSALDDIIDSLRKGNKFSLIDAMAILKAATVTFCTQPSVTEVQAEKDGVVVVVGDLHGQLHDLLFIFKERGLPSEQVKYVFNGDFVDRGNHGCEIALLLFALKLCRPNYIFLNRGNHEEAFINIYSGFEEECLAKYDHKVFQLFQNCFDWMSYACVVNGSAFVIHGGPPSDVGAKVQDIKSLPRGPEATRAEVDSKRAAWYKDMVWSDPHPETSFVGCVHSHRGAGVLWGKDITERFLEVNKLNLIIRSHQCVAGGVETCHGGKVFTLFSASRYCGTGENKGAILAFAHGDKVPQPQNALVWSIPEGEGMLGYERIRSERKGKDAMNDALATQAGEYIIEHRSDLQRHWSIVATKKKRPDLINLFEWADGLSKVLKIKMMWSKVFDKLVKKEHIELNGGKRYVRWRNFLADYSVQLKGGCKVWQDDVVSRITSAVLESGEDLVSAFKSMDIDNSGTISQSEFTMAVRASIPSLAILSEAQLVAVWSAFDADQSGSVDLDEFKAMLSNSMSSNSGDGVVGVRWSTKKFSANESCEEGEQMQPLVPWEENLSEAFGRLFYSHRKELFHIWHSHFDPDESKSIEKEDFKELLRALDESTGKHLLNEESLTKLADGMDLDGDGRIDFKEFCSNIGRMSSNY